MIPKIDT